MDLDLCGSGTIPAPVNKLLVFIIIVLLWVIIGMVVEDMKPQMEAEFARKVRKYAPKPEIRYVFIDTSKPEQKAEKTPVKANGSDREPVKVAKVKIESTPENKPETKE